MGQPVDLIEKIKNWEIFWEIDRATASRADALRWRVNLFGWNACLMGRGMKHYQDTETGNIFAFEDGFDPLASDNRNIPKTLVESVLPKPTETSVWYQGGWVERKDAPINYQDPISSIPAYNPAWMASLRPYTVVVREGRLALTVTLDDVNQNSYDGKQLAKVVGSFSLGNSEKIDALISYDGMIGLLPVS